MESSTPNPMTALSPERREKIDRITQTYIGKLAYQHGAALLHFHDSNLTPEELEALDYAVESYTNVLLRGNCSCLSPEQMVNKANMGDLK